MDVIAKSVYSAAKSWWGSKARAQAQQGKVVWTKLWPALPKEARGPGPELLGPGRGAFSAPSSCLCCHVQALQPCGPAQEQ